MAIGGQAVLLEDQIELRAMILDKTGQKKATACCQGSLDAKLVDQCLSELYAQGADQFL
jgi:hypothetical protein